MKLWRSPVGIVQWLQTVLLALYILQDKFLQIMAVLPYNSCNHIKMVNFEKFFLDRWKNDESSKKQQQMSGPISLDSKVQFSENKTWHQKTEASILSLDALKAKMWTIKHVI